MLRDPPVGACQTDRIGPPLSAKPPREAADFDLGVIKGAKHIHCPTCLIAGVH
jgi:hypothetical protein